MGNRLIILSFFFSGLVLGSSLHGFRPNLNGSHPDYLFENLGSTSAKQDGFDLKGLSPAVKDVVGMLAQLPREKDGQGPGSERALAELKTIASLLGVSIDALVRDFKTIANNMKDDAQWLKDYGPNEANVIRYLVKMAKGQHIELSDLMGNLNNMADKLGQPLPFVVSSLREIARATKEDENSVLWSTHDNKVFNYRLFMSLLSIARQKSVGVREFLGQWEQIAVALQQDWIVVLNNLQEIARSLGPGKNEVDAIAYLYDLSQKSGLTLLDMMKTLAEMAGTRYGKNIPDVLVELKVIAKTLNEDVGSLIKDLASISNKFNQSVDIMLAKWDKIANFTGFLSGIKYFAHLAKGSYKTLPSLMADLFNLSEGQELSSTMAQLETIAKKSEQTLSELLLSLSKAALETSQDLATLMTTLKAMGSLIREDVGEVILDLNNAALSEGRTTLQVIFSELMDMARKAQMTLPALAKELSSMDVSQRKISQGLDTLKSMAQISGQSRADFILDLKILAKRTNETFVELLRNLSFKYGEENLLGLMKTWQNKAKQDTGTWSQYVGGLVGLGKKSSKNWLELVKSRLAEDPKKNAYEVLDTL